MLVAESRPRDLKWFHAGPLLYGDWGTSRLYVLGLAFLYTGHASVLYLTVIGLLMAAVAWAYTVVCRSFPDGGGVYTAARQISPILALVGATLLLSGYIMTAAISVVEALHYFGLHGDLELPLCVLVLLALGAVNWLGARSAGRLALIVAFAALGMSAVVGLLCLPFFAKGVQTISLDYFTQTSPQHAWVNFTRICLALAGVEAVANMTGLMKQPVHRTAKRTIWPVAIEVVALNLVFGLALAGLDYSAGGRTLAESTHPDEIRIVEQRAAFLETLSDRSGLTPDEPLELTDDQLAQLDASQRAAYDGLAAYEAETERYTNASMKIVTERSVARFFGPAAGSLVGQIAGVIFGLLLISASNTAVMATVSVLFAMGQDRELPGSLTRLNFSGVPWIGLIVAIVAPLAVIAVERDVTVLAELYVLGVCGAITVTILSCVGNRSLDITTGARVAMAAIGTLLFAITATIAVTEPVSTAFSGSLIALVLGSRAVVRASKGASAAPLPEPITGWLAEVRASSEKLRIDPDKPRVMLAARGRFQAEFAVDIARRRNATLFVLFIRPIRIMDLRPGQLPTIDSDRDAQEALGSVALLGKANGVPVVPIYVVSPNIAEEILDHTVTYGCDTVILGKSRRNLLSRKLQGDVVSQVATHLPDDIALITRSGSDPHPSKLLIPEPAAAPHDDHAEAPTDAPAEAPAREEPTKPTPPQA